MKEWKIEAASQVENNDRKQKHKESGNPEIVLKLND
jgi:hypothetical protein